MFPGKSPQPEPISFAFGANRKFIDKTGADKLSGPNQFSAGTGTFKTLSAHIGMGYPWMPALLDSGARRKQDFANIAEILGLDIDANLTIEDAVNHPFIAAHCGLLQPSASHTDEHHKFRLVFALPRAVEGCQNIRICNRYLAHMVGSADPSCKDASRFFYGAKGSKPVLLQDVRLPETFIEDAIAWDAAQTVAQKQRPASSQRVANEARSTNNHDDDALLMAALQAIPPDCEYNEWIAIGMALCGLGHDFSVWDNWSSGAATYNAGEMASRWKSFSGGDGDVSTIFGIAKKYGWKYPKRAKTKSAPRPRRKNIHGEEACSLTYFEQGQSGQGFELVVKERDKHEFPAVVKLPSHGAIAEFFLGKYEGRIGRTPGAGKQTIDLYLFREETGLMQKIDPANLICEIRAESLRCHAESFPWPMIDQISTGWLKSCEEQIRISAPEITLNTPDRPLVPLANGVFNTMTFELTAYDVEVDRGNFFTYQSVYPYDPTAAPPVRWLRYLAECVDPRDVELLRATMLATLAGWYRLKFNVELIGGRDCGKSVIQRLVAALFGAQLSPVVAPVNYRKLLNPDNKFAVSSLVGKKLAIVADTKGLVGLSDVFKQMTSGGDALEAEGKNKDAIAFVCFAILWTAGNAPIRFSDDDDATRSRRLIIRFPHTITADKQHPLLDWAQDGTTPNGELVPELAGILNWILAAAETAESTIKAAKESASNDAGLATNDNPLAKWLSANVALCDGFSTSVGNSYTADTLYESYYRWCLGNNYKPLGNGHFLTNFMELTTRFQTVVTVKQIEVNRRSTITGVGLIYSNGGQLDEFALNNGRDIAGDYLVPRVENPIDPPPAEIQVTQDIWAESVPEAVVITMEPELAAIEPPAAVANWQPAIGERVAVERKNGWFPATVSAVPDHHPNPAVRCSAYRVTLENGLPAIVWNINNLRPAQQPCTVAV
jgi:phage/plasmid-associated DNA primase